MREMGDGAEQSRSKSPSKQEQARVTGTGQQVDVTPVGTETEGSYHALLGDTLAPLTLSLSLSFSLCRLVETSQKPGDIKWALLVACCSALMVARAVCTRLAHGSPGAGLAHPDCRVVVAVSSTQLDPYSAARTHRQTRRGQVPGTGLSRSLPKAYRALDACAWCV